MTETIHLTPKALESIAVELWGEDKWRAQVQDALGISYSQLHRYMTVYRGQRIPRVVALAMTAMVTLKRNEIALETPKFVAADLKPVKFIWEAKPKTVRVINDAPEIDLFGSGPEEPEKPKDAPSKPPAPDVKAEEPPAPAKPSRKRAMPPETKPAAKKAGPAKDKAGPVKAGPEKTAPAKKPSLAKASAALGKALTPKAPAKKTAKKPAK